MCIQYICPHCSAAFTSPSSILRCPVFEHHDPPLDPRRLTCPANKWVRTAHINGFHPGGEACPYRPGPYYLGYLDKLITPTSGIKVNSSRALAPAPGSQRTLPHEGSKLYVRPGDLFKPGMWQKVMEGLTRAEEEKERLQMEQEELEEERVWALEREKERARLIERRRKRLQEEEEAGRERERKRARVMEKRERERVMEERKRAKVMEERKQAKVMEERLLGTQKEDEGDGKEEHEKDKRQEGEESHDLVAAQWKIR